MSYNLGTAAGQIVIDGSGASKGFNVAQAAAGGFATVIRARMDEVTRMGERLVAVGAAGVTGFGIAVKAASSFEAELSGIQAVSGATGQQMDQIRQLALRLGKETVFSAGEAAQAIQELVKAGVPLPDIMNGAADATVNLAAAGGIGLSEAAAIASAAMNQFSIAGAEMPKVADAIAGAANASSIDVSDFGQSLNQVGAVAHTVGLSFGDTAVAIAEMGKQGIRGSDAGTSLKTMLLNLIPATQQQLQVMQQLGIVSFDGTKALQALNNIGIHPLSSSFQDVTKAVNDYVAQTQGYAVGTQSNINASNQLLMTFGALGNAFFDQNGKVKSLRDVQQVLQDSTKNLTQEQKLNALQVMFGSDAIRAASVLANGGATAFDNMSAAMGKVSAADVAKTRMDNLAGSVENLKGSLETAQIIIGSVILPIIRKFIDGINWLVNLFNNLPGPIQTAIGVLFGMGTVFSLVAGGLTLLLVALPKLLAHMLLFKTLGAVSDSVMVFWKALRAGEGAIGALQAVGGVWTALAGRVTLLYRIAMAARVMWVALTGPVGIIVAAIAAIVAGFIYAYNHFKWFHDGVDAMVSAIVGFFTNLWHSIVGIAQQIGAWFTGPFLSFFQGIPGFFSNLWNGIVSFFTSIPGRIAAAFSAVISFFAGLPGQILGALASLGSMIASAATSAFQWLLSAAVSAGEAVLNFIITLPNRILYGLGFLVGTVVRYAPIIWNSLVDWLETTIIKIGVFFYELPGKVAAWIAGIAASVATWASNTWTSLVTWLATTGVQIGQWFANLPGQLAGFFTSLAASIFAWAVATWHNIITGLEQAGAAIVAFFVALPGNIASFFTSLGASLLSWGISTFNNIVVGLATAGAAVLAWFQALPANILAMVVNAGTWLLQAGSDIVNGLWNGLKAAWNGFVGWVVGLWNSFIQGFKDAMGIGSPSRVFMEFGQWLIQGLWNGLQALVGMIWDFFTNLISKILNFFSGVGTWLLDAGKSLLSGLWNGIKNIWNAEWHFFDDLKNKIGSFFSGAWNWLMNAGQNLIHGLWTGIQTIWNAEWHILGDIPGKIGNFFSSAGSWLLNAGKNLVQGLWNGISGAAGWLWGQIQGWISGIKNKVLGFFGIKSPSRMFMEIGNYLTQGLGKGIAAGAGAAANEAAKMAMQVADSFDSAMPALTATLGAKAALLPTDMAGQMANDLAGARVGLGTGAVAGKMVSADAPAPIVQNFNTTVNNPAAEKTSDTEARRLRTLSALGAIAR